MKQGIVVFFSPNYKSGTITESDRTPVLPFEQAMQHYAETPNPASQLLQFGTEEEMIAAEAQLQKNIKDPQWLEELFECI